MILYSTVYKMLINCILVLYMFPSVCDLVNKAIDLYWKKRLKGTGEMGSGVGGGVEKK